MTHAEYMEAAQVLQAQVETALHVDADTEVGADVHHDGVNAWPVVTLTEEAVKRLLELLADDSVARAVLAERACCAKVAASVKAYALDRNAAGAVVAAGDIERKILARGES